MSTVLQRVTLEEFLTRPDRADNQREELIEGEIVLSPEPKPSHAQIVGRLRDALKPLRQQGFVIEGPFSCILTQHSVPGPDLGAVREERWRQAIAQDKYLADAPELVIEVRSPSNRQLGRKASLYMEHGAEAVWVVNPKRRAVLVYDHEEVREIREGEQLQFHGVAVEVAEIFR
jgi:Uma2 family endonuclease